MLGKLNDVKKKVGEVKLSLKNIELKEHSQDELVSVLLSADKTLKEIKLSKEFYEKSIEERETLLVQTINKSLAKADERAKEIMKQELNGVIPDIPGLDVGNLLGGL